MWHQLELKLRVGGWGRLLLRSWSLLAAFQKKLCLCSCKLKSESRNGRAAADTPRFHFLLSFLCMSRRFSLLDLLLMQALYQCLLRLIKKFHSRIPTITVGTTRSLRFQVCRKSRVQFLNHRVEVRIRSQRSSGRAVNPAFRTLLEPNT